MYQLGNGPSPTRPKPIYEPGPSFTPSQPTPAFPQTRPAPFVAPGHQAPRPKNRFARHRGLTGLGVIIGLGMVVTLIATSGGSGSGKPVPKTIGYSGSNAVEFAEAAGITDYEGLDQVPGKTAFAGSLDDGMWGAPGNGAGSLACWLTHAGLVNWEHVHGADSNVQTVDLSEYCAAWIVTS